MSKKLYYPIGIGAGIAIISIVLIASMDFGEKTNFEPTLALDFTYEDGNSNLKKTLGETGISMSSPIKLSKPSDIAKFCSFFTDESLQKLVKYCTSTELRDVDENYLGNIHMLGNPELPNLVLVVTQTGPFMNNLPEIKSVFNSVIENLVCSCWEEIQPSGIANVDEWIDRHREFHLDAVRTTSKSNLNLEGKQLQIEITTNTEGYLWKLFVATQST